MKVQAAYPDYPTSDHWKGLFVPSVFALLDSNPSVATKPNLSEG